MPFASNVEKLRVGVVEDMRDTRESLVFLINATEDMTCVAAVASAEEALEQFPAANPQFVLLDIELAGELNGVDCIERLAKSLPAAKIIMLTDSQDATTVTRCLAHGAVGYLHKSQPPERLPQSLREAADGGSPMSPDIARLVREFFKSLAPADHEWEKLSTREQDVLDLLIRGCVKKEIANQLIISEETVRTHCAHIYRKLHVNCREHAVAKAMPLAALEWMKPRIPTKTRHLKGP
jgi:DNA-binding NarL/FixJ family response regulator